MPTLFDIRALLFDVDNTLIGEDKKIPTLVQDSLQQLSQQGKHIGIASGKSFAHLRHQILEAFPADALHILCGGAQITNSQGHVLWEKTIPAETVERVTAVLLAHNIQFFLVDGSVLRASPQCLDYLQNHALKPEVTLLEKPWTKPTPVLSIYKFEDKNVAPLLTPFTAELHMIDASGNSNKQVYDITVNGVNKGAAFLEWCKLQQLEPSAVMSFGDGDNDEPILTLAGWAVVMENGTEKMKALAQRVIGNVNENGLGVYLQSMLQTQQL